MSNVHDSEEMWMPVVERKIESISQNYKEKLVLTFGGRVIPQELFLDGTEQHADIKRITYTEVCGKPWNIFDLNRLRLIFRDDLDILPFILSDIGKFRLLPVFLQSGVEALQNGDIFSDSMERFLIPPHASSPIFERDRLKGLVKAVDILAADCIVGYVSFASLGRVLLGDPAIFTDLRAQIALSFWCDVLKSKLLGNEASWFV